MVFEDKEKRVNISIRRETRGTLDSIRHIGQSYDGVIQELIRFWKGEHPEEIARQPLEAVAAKESS